VSLNALVSECLSVVSLFGHGPITRYGRIRLPQPTLSACWRSGSQVMIDWGRAIAAHELWGFNSFDDVNKARLDNR